MPFRSDIEGIRAIAILLVALFHFRLVGESGAGFIGVDVFFVISGFLISGIIWKDLEAGTFSLASFYARRIRRLAPALVVVQVLMLAVAAIAFVPAEVAGLLKESLAAQFYLSNVYYWRTLNYFGVDANQSYLLHTWSLAVEEQFYLFFPLLLMAVHRWARRWLRLVLIVVAAGSFALNLALVGSKPEAAFYLLPTRAWELMVGALLPLVLPWCARTAWARGLAGPVGLGLIAAALVVYTPDIPFPGWFALLPVAASALLLLAGSGEGSPVSQVLGTVVPGFFGRISYPLYLVHWPVYVLGMNLLPEFGPAARWGGMALSVLLAWAITRFVEAPVRHRRWLVRDRAIWGAYALALAGVVGVFASAVVSDGWRFRLPEPVLRIADVANEGDLGGKAWSYMPSKPFADQLRVVGAPGAVPVWLIYGDSHASALAESLDLWLQQRGEAGVLAFASGCLPLLDTGDARCRAFNREAVEFARSHKVLLVSIWRQPIEPGYHGRDGAPLAGAAARADFAEALAHTVAALRANAASVHVWEPLPSAPRRVPPALARDLLFGPHWPVERSLASHRQELGFVAQALDRAGVPAGDRVDPAPAVCPGGRCTFEVDGLPLYADNNHPARHTAPAFAALLGQLGQGTAR